MAARAGDVRPLLAPEEASPEALEDQVDSRDTEAASAAERSVQLRRVAYIGVGVACVFIGAVLTLQGLPRTRHAATTQNSLRTLQTAAALPLATTTPMFTAIAVMTLPPDAQAIDKFHTTTTTPPPPTPAPTFQQLNAPPTPHPTFPTTPPTAMPTVAVTAPPTTALAPLLAPPTMMPTAAVTVVYTTGAPAEAAVFETTAAAPATVSLVITGQPTGPPTEPIPTTTAPPTAAPATYAPTKAMTMTPTAATTTAAATVFSTVAPLEGVSTTMPAMATVAGVATSGLAGWVRLELDCYHKQGAEAAPFAADDSVDIVGEGDVQHITDLSLEQCELHCSMSPGCTAVTYTNLKNPTECYGRKDINPAQCKYDGTYETFVNVATATAPAEGSWKEMEKKYKDAPVGGGHWCEVKVPKAEDVLNTCVKSDPKIQVKVLTYNLFWWHLFGVQKGNDGSAGKTIAKGALIDAEDFDLMGFQECENVWTVLEDGGLKEKYDAYQGNHSICIAYKKDVFFPLGVGQVDVAEDRQDQWYGRRAVQWFRLAHKASGRTVFFMNHHGPLPVDTGGVCGGPATAYNIVRVAKEHMEPDDAFILTGDFNSDSTSTEITTLNTLVHEVTHGTAFGGVDHIYSNCAGTGVKRSDGTDSVINAKNLGGGGSDHDALMAEFYL